MKRIIGVLILGMCFFNSTGATEKEQILLKGDDISEWKGMVKINTSVKHSNIGSFELYGKYPTELISSQMFPVDMNKTYIISAWMRSLDDHFPASANLGMRMYDKDRKEIKINNECSYPDTETSTAADSVIGSKELLVVKNPEWLKIKHSLIAFNIKEQYQDLPNFDLSPQIEKLIDEGARYKVVLRGPLEKTYPAGTKIRLHSPWGAPFYWGADGWMPMEWKNFSNTIKGEAQNGTPKDKFWKGTKYVRIFVWFGNWNRIPKEEARLLVDDIKFISMEAEE